MCNPIAIPPRQKSPFAIDKGPSMSKRECMHLGIPTDKQNESNYPYPEWEWNNSKCDGVLHIKNILYFEHFVPTKKICKTIGSGDVLTLRNVRRQGRPVMIGKELPINFVQGGDEVDETKFVVLWVLKKFCRSQHLAHVLHVLDKVQEFEDLSVEHFSGRLGKFLQQL
jgi:hypothetical protein